MSKQAKLTGKNVVFISDTQLPYQHRDAVPFARAVADRIGPDHIIHVGDFFDNHAAGRYVRSHLSKGDHWEVVESRRSVANEWQWCPDLYVIEGNHDVRGVARLVETGLTPMRHASPEVLYGTPSTWTWCDSVLLNKEILVIHGDKPRVTPLLRLALANAMSVVAGHHHRQLSVNHATNKMGKPLWAMAVGALIDRRRFAFDYSKKDGVTDSCDGLGVLWGGEPYVIRMGTRKSGRWDGKVRF